MTTTPENETSETRPNLLIGMLARAGQIGITFLVQGAVLFLAAGRLNWIWGWLFLGIYLVSVIINASFMLRTNAEEIAERGKPKEMKNWDKWIGSIWGLVQFLILPAVAGLDLRFSWSPAPGIGWHLAGAVAFAAGLGLFGWAMITNAYFSTVVRIQTDRGQTVCQEGPYRFVRHPGYTGAILQSLAIPFLLGSWWSLIPGVAAAALMILRTSLEDRTLKAELPGYQAFAEQVRYRLAPGVW